MYGVRKCPRKSSPRKKIILKAQALNEGKPEKIVERMVQGRIEKYTRKVCLMEQPFIKKPRLLR
jgi:elongation factor Ts